MILGINAGRARSGGGVAHLIGILQAASPSDFGFKEIHVWSYGKLLNALPAEPWLIKHSPAELDRSLLHQLWWERDGLPKELRAAGCDIVLNVDAGSVCRFRPSVTISRDMLSYEPGEMRRFGFSKETLRLIALRYVQNASLKHADGAVFLTRYAARIIQASCGRLANVAFIPHGVGSAFQAVERPNPWPRTGERPIRCLYVSNAAPYKHQWHVVKAVEQLRALGRDLSLELVGGGSGRAQMRLEAQIATSDPDGVFVRQRGFVSQQGLPALLAQADLFVFASSCENMPNTLVEAMASGLPIACSDRGPMPEVLEDAGVYFDPENPDSIAAAVDELIMDPGKRSHCARRAREISKKYSWPRCANETLSFVAQVAARA